MVWVAGGATAAVLLLTAGLVAVTMVNGLGVFWPHDVQRLALVDGSAALGEPVDSAVNPDDGVRSLQFKVGNREFDRERQDFRWYPESEIAEVSLPDDVVVLERTGNGNFYGFLSRVEGPLVAREADDPLVASWAAVAAEVESAIAPRERRLAALNAQLRQVGNEILRARHRRDGDRESAADGDERLAALRGRSERLLAESDRENAAKLAAAEKLRTNLAVFRTAQGDERPIALVDIVRLYRPNAMGFGDKLLHYLGKVKELFVAWPRESNTEGGLFPAIFGTVMLVFLMSISCFPLGVLAGVYLGEYAKEGTLVRLVRIAVNNLAGIPSIVYGMFGLGFFVYGLGKAVDRWFFPEALAAKQPVYATGGVLWASLTLGLLTVPVVIVATEEALRAVPRALREGSYALGATKLQTLWRALLPVASPGILTGFILAMARAAGEVAPLMLTGAVKIVSDLSVDGSLPYFHPDRKFMHLGYHIYDIAFQSPNVEATKPMVYVTTLLLLLIVLAMSAAAIALRNRMKRRLQARAI